MLGLGELIFVLVIVVQGVAAIAAAAHKKKQRAAARAKEIEALEGPGAAPARSFDDAGDLARERELKTEQKRLEKQRKREARQAQVKQLREAMEQSSGMSMKDAMSMMGLPVATEQPPAAPTRASVSVDPAPGAPDLSGMRAVPPMPPPAARPAMSRPVANDEAGSAQSSGRKAKRSPFASSGAGSENASGLRSGRGVQPSGLGLRKTLRNRRALRQAFVLKTLLEPPVALQDDPETLR